MATISLVASHEQSVKKEHHYHNIKISDINSKIVNTLPRYAKITKVLLRVNTKVSSGLPMCELYCYLGNNAGTSSNNTNLGKKSGDLPTSAKDYDWDLSSYFNSEGHNTYPYTMNTSSTYLIPFWNNDYIFSFKITCKVDLIVEYTNLSVISPIIYPEGAGTVSGGGVYNTYDTVTLTAKPNDGYSFKYWRVKLSDGSGRTTILSYDNPFTDYAAALEVGHELTAVFEKLPPEFTSASMTYLNKQISSSNKVICKEGFIISVGVT